RAVRPRCPGNVPAASQNTDYRHLRTERPACDPEAIGEGDRAGSSPFLRGEAVDRGTERGARPVERAKFDWAAHPLGMLDTAIHAFADAAIDLDNGCLRPPAPDKPGADALLALQCHTVA